MILARGPWARWEVAGPLRSENLEKRAHAHGSDQTPLRKKPMRNSSRSGKARMPTRQARAEAGRLHEKGTRRQFPVYSTSRDRRPPVTPGRRYFLRASLTATPSSSFRSVSSIWPSRPRILLMNAPHLPERPHSSDAPSFLRGITSGLAGPFP